MLRPEVAVALAAVRAASLVCRTVQSQITREAIEKKDRSPVTIADYASQAVICKALAEAFPSDPVIGEEDSAQLRGGDSKFLNQVRSELDKAGISGSDAEVCRWIDHGGAQGYSSRFWTLDPIDGTKGFLRGEQYAVSLALIVDGQIEIGVLGCPNLPAADAWDRRRGCVLVSERGRGTQLYILDEPETPPQSVRTSGTGQAALARVCESVESGHTDQSISANILASLGITAPPVRMDSQAKYAAVARGEADIYLRLPTRADYREMIWDHAGGVLAVEAAGGRVTDIDGLPLDFTHGRTLAKNRGVVVTNGSLHDEVLAAIKSHFPAAAQQG